MGEPKVYEVGEWEEVFFPVDTITYEWCCDCSLRHIVKYDVVKKRGKVYVSRRTARDDWATWASRKLK